MVSSWCIYPDTESNNIGEDGQFNPTLLEWWVLCTTETLRRNNAHTVGLSGDYCVGVTVTHTIHLSGSVFGDYRSRHLGGEGPRYLSSRG